ncbi:MULTISPECIES: DUF4265 domain-containing protein [unclassified Anaeromyxobacter]|uniref:DUF4265 domain-containing protein n=1 Tax=unclassified Anaeromyxobacter TaxID=2620896 RepID=UPI001F5835FF|nr:MULTISPECIES: DUF4265 domain-containing protein [unclassified Anaeromyxobacter]
MTTELDIGETLIRIRVPLERSDGEAGPPDDWLWAEPLGAGRYRVESCPFFAYGISRDDVVLAATEGEGGGAVDEDAPRLDDVVEKCGHRTLRLALDPGAELSDEGVQTFLERLLEHGCTHEALRPKLVAVDVPPEVDVARVAEVLQDRANEGLLVWEWADPRPC